MSEQQIEQFPHLKKAINASGETIEIPFEEYRAIYDFFHDQGINLLFIEYQNVYYELTFGSFTP